MDDIAVETVDGVTVVVPASLAAISTYVLLEQEGWFEKELGFVRRFLQPGMSAIDVGANHGAYALPMLARVGAAGRVLAIEPNAAVAARLRRSAAAWPASCFALAEVAVSDAPGRGTLVVESASEAGRLGRDLLPGAAGVPVRTLDDLAQEHLSAPIDLLKIDVEGHELAAMRGARQLLRESAPVVLFEMQSAAVVDHGPMAQLRADGAAIARWLPGGPLVIVAPDERIDPYEINLLAFAGEAQARLRARGLLSLPAERGVPSAPGTGLSELVALPFLQSISDGFARADRLHPLYRAALDSYAVWRDADRDMDARVAAIRDAAARLKALCREAPTHARLSTLGRVASEAGEREAAVQAMERFLVDAGQSGVTLDEPFWPPLPRFDALQPVKATDALIVAVIDAHAQWKGFSSYFSFPLEEFFWACGSPHASPAMRRRSCLARWRVGRPVPDGDIEAAAQGALNAPLWRDGTVARLARR
ncbi:MAG: FkbM family methyltransferase [Alphaproteobacteria bacterium]|nr:FkbM family methyltransferase [Alphaproteobacteria bacterium]